MKNLLILALLFLPFSIGFGMDEPLTYSQAYNKAKVENKQLLIIFSMPRCLYCDILEDDINKSAKLSFVKEKYIVLKKRFTNPLEMEKPLQQIHRYAKVNMVPHSISIDVKKNVYGKQKIGYGQADWIKVFK